MIKSGGSFFFEGACCVIGAVVSINERPYIAAASHIFQKGGVGSRILVDGTEGIVSKFLEDYDIALIEIPSGCTAEITRFGSAIVLDEARLVNEHHSIRCQVTSSGASLLFLLFPCSDMPQPGDSGSPIQQGGKVVGLLSSVMLGNCTGTAVSSDVLRDLNS